MTRILIADDHEIVRRGLRDLLAEEFPALELREAGDARAALDLARAEGWDLVLLDIGLPGLSGLEVLQEIKRVQPRTPVLVLSMYPEQAYAVQALKLGAAGYLTKQSAADELRLALRKVLAGGRYVSTSLAEQLAASLGGDNPPSRHQLLSPRELQVLRGVASGRTLKEIAADMHLSEKTIATYRARLTEKMGLRTNVELTRYALQQGLIE